MLLSNFVFNAHFSNKNFYYMFFFSRKISGTCKKNLLCFNLFGFFSFWSIGFETDILGGWARVCGGRFGKKRVFWCEKRCIHMVWEKPTEGDGEGLKIVHQSLMKVRYSNWSYHILSKTLTIFKRVVISRYLVTVFSKIAKLSKFQLNFSN